MADTSPRGAPRAGTSMLRAYPVPFFAAAGLAAGGVLYLAFGDYEAARWVWYAVLILGGAPIVLKTSAGMARGKFAADVVAMLAIVTAILTDEAFAGVVIVLMQSGGEAIDDLGFKRATSSLEKLVSRAPRLARRRRDHTVEEIGVEAVGAGDTLVVRPGDLVPVDGVVASQGAEIDESALTGEPLPRTKGPGGELLSGSVNVGQAFEMKATRRSSESQYAKIVDLVRKAQMEKPPIQRLADRYAALFTPLTVAMAFLGYALTGTVTAFLAVLVVATPCPLILATPLAVISGVNKAAKESIIVKSGSAIERIGEGRVVIFDKTGTLTYGEPVLETVLSFDGNGSEVLKLAASVEQLSSHPIANALASEGKERFGVLPIATDFVESPGRGVRARIGGRDVVIGTQAYLEEIVGRAYRPEDEETIRQAQKRGSTVTFVAIDGKPAGAVMFSDMLRPGVPALIQKLRELGVEQTVMLTGDNKTNAAIVARRAGIEKVGANLLPGEKLREVKRLTQEFENSIMVGDGINDAPALASATVGVAMGAHGTGISAEAADVVLLVDDVTKLGDGMAIGRRTLQIAKQSILFGMGGSVVLMVIASLGFIEPAVGAVIQEVLDVAVIINALRVR